MKRNLNLPDLIEIQRSSYCWFLTTGLSSILEVFSLLCNSKNNLKIQVFGGDYHLEQPKYDLFETKNRDETYATQLVIPIDIIYQFGEQRKALPKKMQKKIFKEGKNKITIGYLPLMTKHGTFMINGCERVVVNQIIRNPGLYFQKKCVRKGHYKYSALLIPNRGSWLKFEIQKKKFIPETLKTRAEKKEQKFWEKEERLNVEKTLDNEKKKLNREKQKLFHYEKKRYEKAEKREKELCLIIDKQNIYPVEYIFEWIKDNEIFNVADAQITKDFYLLKNKAGLNTIHSFFKENQFSTSVNTSFTQIISNYYFLKHKSTLLNDEEKLHYLKSFDYSTLNTKNFENNLLISIYLTLPEEDFKKYPIINEIIQKISKTDFDISRMHKNKQQNQTIDEILGDLKGTSFLLEDYNLFHGENKPYLQDQDKFTKIERLFSRLFNYKYYDLSELGRLKLNNKINLNLSLKTTILTIQDFFFICDRFIKFRKSNLPSDDVDNLKNRRIRSIGELLHNQLYLGLRRLEKTIQDKIKKSGENSEIDEFEPNIFNARPITALLKEFFGSGQLSQFMDQTNPLAEITHRRRVTGLGPGGFNKDHVSLAARDIHPSQYGRICPIETSEGQNVGLVTSLASYAKIGKYGRLEVPYYEVKNGKILLEKGIIYMSADKEENFKIASGDIKIDHYNSITNTNVIVRSNKKFQIVNRTKVDLVDISPLQIISISTSLIPFLEHDDANRALMGSNMQRQAVPLIYPRKALVGTGLETQVVANSELIISAYKAGKIKKVTSDQILVEEKSGEKRCYLLRKYMRSNQGTCINQRPIVWPGEYILPGQILADGPGTQDGELALGQNLTVAYVPWEGYNYEDAVLIGENLIYDNLLTSIHIEDYDFQVKETKAGFDEITKNIPDINSKAVAHLDDNGIVLKGSYVVAGDILVGKVTPKTDSDELPEGRLLKAIFGQESSPDVFDSSFRTKKNSSGRVVDIRIFMDENGDKLPYGTSCIIRIFLAKIKRIQVGDKISGRHGNKGIISKVLPIQDMPFLPNGKHIDIILNPLGVPSRMNVGQIFECLLGFAGDNLKKRFKILPFDELYQRNASRILINEQLKKAALESKQKWIYNSYFPGKVILTDGRTGENFDNPITVGKAYILKLIHLVSHKIHARSTGPYSLVTQQPLKGRSMHGGQRFGEMEVWALEAFGAAYTLQELMTIKSDDIEGRNSIVHAIIKGEPIPPPGVPESFKVLLKELRALGLDMGVYKIQRLKNLDLESLEVDLTHIPNDAIIDSI